MAVGDTKTTFNIVVHYAEYTNQCGGYETFDDAMMDAEMFMENPRAISFEIEVVSATVCYIRR